MDKGARRAADRRADHERSGSYDGGGEIFRQRKGSPRQLHAATSAPTVERSCGPSRRSTGRSPTVSVPGAGDSQVVQGRIHHAARTHPHAHESRRHLLPRCAAQRDHCLSKRHRVERPTPGAESHLAPQIRTPSPPARRPRSAVFPEQSGGFDSYLVALSLDGKSVLLEQMSSRPSQLNYRVVAIDGGRVEVDLPLPALSTLPLETVSAARSRISEIPYFQRTRGRPRRPAPCSDPFGLEACPPRRSALTETHQACGAIICAGPA